MKTNDVNQCSCCGVRFIRVTLDQKIPGYLEKDFVWLLGNDVDDLFLSRQFYLSSEDGYIVSFYYEFQNEKEEQSANDLERSVKLISSYLYDHCVVDGRDIVLEEF